MLDAAPHAQRHPLLAPQRAWLTTYREDLRAVSVSVRCRFADAFARAKEGWSWGDGMHPGPQGHRAIAEALKEAWKFGEPLADE